MGRRHKNPSSPLAKPAEPASAAPALDRAIRVVGLSLALALVFVSRLTIVNDHDVFLHLRTGQWILENRAIPRADPFSYSAAGAEWDDHEWLFQVFAYLASLAGGIAAVGLARAAVQTLSLFLLYRLCRLKGAAALPSAALTLYAAAGAWVFNEPRPYIVTPLGLVLFGLALERLRPGEHRDAAARRWIWVPPVVMLFWVNMHAGFTAGCILLVVVFAGQMADNLRARFGGTGLQLADRGRDAGAAKKPAHAPKTQRVLWNAPARDLLLCGALTFVAVLCNPYGWTILLFPFKLVGHDVFMQVILEWNPSVLGRDSALFYALALALGLRAMTLAPRARAADLLAVVVFTLMALSSRRHVSLFFFVLTPVAAEWFASRRRRGAVTVLAEQEHAPAQSEESSRIQGGASPASRARLPWASISRAFSAQRVLGRALGWAALLGAAAWWMLPTMKSSPILRTSLEYNSLIFPTRACDLVRQYRLKPRLLNGYNFGGYLINRFYPDYQVFIDGRADVYGVEITRTYAQIAAALPGWENELDALGVNFVLTDEPLSDRALLVDALVESKSWVLVYWDDKSFLFVRDIPEHRQIIAERAFRRIHPRKVDAAFADRWRTPRERSEGLAELERRAAEPEPCLMVERNLSYLYGRMGEPKKAIDAVDRYLNIESDNPAMIYRRGQLHEQLGMDEDARIDYARALRFNPNFGAALVRLGALAEKHLNLKRAAKFYGRAYRARPMNPVGALHYANVLLRFESWQEAAGVLRDYLEAKPNDTSAWEMLAYCYGRTSEPFRAAQAKDRARTVQANRATP